MAPIIAQPTANPYYSQASSVVVSGACMSGFTVTLTGSSTLSQACANSSFSFNVQNSTDGVYSYVISQTSANTYSTPVNFVWIKKSSIAPPGLTYPASSPFLSGLPSLTITGSCENGSTVSLSVDGSGSTVCNNSQYSLNLPKSADGDYNITVNQGDAAGNSASTSFIWKKHTLSVSPSNPFLVVGSLQFLTISGGSGSYSVTQTANNSGGSYNTSTGFYTVGHIANVVDTLTVTDTLGVSATVNITTSAGAADHLVLPATNGSGQTGTVGQALGTVLTVQVTDRFGNGISAVPLYVRTLVGDAVITSSTMPVSDVNGNVQVTVQMGYTSAVNVIWFGTLTANGALPDLAQTGNGTLQITEMAKSLSSGQIGSTFKVGTNPGALVLTDLNRDGYPDVAVLNVTAPSSVGILLGQKNGLFGSMSTISGICTGPNFIASGVFTSSGYTDLIVVCSGSGKYSMLISNGNGTFQSPINYSTGANETTPMSVAVADFDKDGKLDVAFATIGGVNVGVHYGNGDGTFAANPVEIPVGQGASNVVAFDINRDGYPDLAVANSGDGTITVILNNGGGSRAFTSQGPLQAGGGPVQLVTGDFNSDGWTDLACVNNTDSNVYIYLNLAGVLTQNYIAPTGSSPTSLAAGDFNGDGKKDLIVTNSGDNTVLLLIGQGDGTFASGSTINVETNPVFIAAGDVDKDGHLDVVLTGNTDSVIQVLPNQGGAVFGYVASTGNSPVAAVTADFNNDGIPDVAVINSGSMTVTLLKGLPIGFTTKTNGFMSPSTWASLATGASPSAIATADFDRDGCADLVIANQTAGKVWVYLGNCNGTFKAYSSYGVGSNPAGIAIADFNGDGYPDIAVANSGSSNVSILINNQNGTFGNKTDYAVDSGPAGIVAGNFNSIASGDTNMDLAVATGSTVSILLGKGTGGFLPYQSYTTGSGASSLVARDLNSDGILDIATANSSDGTVSVLIGNGDGTFKTKTDYACGSSPTAISTADFKGLGHNDLVIANGPSGTFTILFNSTGNFTNQLSLSTNVLTPSLVVGDFNKDGASDVLLIDATDNAVQTWMGH